MAAPQVGAQSFALVGKETVFNTPVATTNDWGYIDSIKSAFKNNSNSINVLGDRQTVDNVVGNFDGSLSIDGHLNSGAILKALFGQETAAATSSDYTHTFFAKAGSPATMAKNINSYTISENMSGATDIVFTHSGSKVNNVDITLELDKTLRFSSEIFTTGIVTGTTAGTRTITTTKPTASWQGTLSMCATGGSYAAVGIPIKFNVGFNNNIDPKDVKQLGSRFNNELMPKMLTNKCSFTQKFSTLTEYALFLGGTSPAAGVTNVDVKMTINNGVTLGSGRVEFFIELENGSLNTVDVQKSTDNVVEATYELVGARVKNIYFVDAKASYN